MKNFLSEDKLKTDISLWGLLKKMWPYNRPYWLSLVTVLLSILLATAAARVLPSIIGYSIDDGFLKKDFAIVKACAFAYLAIQIFKTLLQFFYSWYFQKIGNRVLYDLRQKLVAHIQNLEISYFHKNPVGRTVTRMTNDVSNLGDLFSESLISIFTETLTLVSIVISMALISWKLALATLVIAPVFIWLSLMINNRMRMILRDSKQKLSELNSFLGENISGMKVVQLYRKEGTHFSHFKKLSTEYANQVIESIKVSVLLQPVMNIFTGVTVTIALYYGGALSLDQQLAVGSLVAFVMHTQDFIFPLREVLDKIQQFQNSLTSAERVFQLFDEKEEYFSSKAIAQDLPPKNAPTIEVNNLAFKYESHLPTVLEIPFLSIPKNQSVALVGRTGSGKSTLVSLLQKFYRAQGDCLKIDGVSIEAIPLELLRKKIGVVQQDSFIFRGSIIDNVTLMDSAVDQQKAIQACTRIGYLQFLKDTGRDLDFKVEERGANLSSGEKQLIAFARILTFEPELLILDEATANVDSKTEALIQKATNEVIRDRTSLIIAHRLSTIRDCERILVLDQGKIVEDGSHQILLQAGGAYSKMNAQSSVSL